MNIIKNEKEIATSETRSQLLQIITTGLNSVCPYILIESSVSYNKHFNSISVHGKTYDLLKGRIFAIGGGKAAGHMAEAIEKVIEPSRITAGLVTCVSDNYKTKKIRLKKAGHPLPDHRGEKAVNEMLGFKDEYDINERDLVLCLISGGGSSLMTAPVDEITLKEKQAITQLLLESGANIQEINAIRKHLSKIKGGRLAEYFYPAQVVSLIISDVVGDRLEAIASGPTVMDPTTFPDACDILLKYNLSPHAPKAIIDYLKKGTRGELAETPKSLKNSDNYIIGNNAVALEAMATQAKLLDLKPLIIATNLQGEPDTMANLMAKEVIRGEFKNYNVLLMGGETTPALAQKHGRGGRNMQFTASTMSALKEYRGDWAVASIDTDGSDYLTGYAGAIADKHTMHIAMEKDLDISQYINDYNAYQLFKKTGSSLVDTGPTGTNVGDIVVYMLE